MKEEWRPVVGYEGLYEVSSLGRVKKISGFDRTGAYRKGFFMTLHKNERGYLRIGLRNGKRRNHSVHSLVASAFIGPRPEGLVIDHIDGNRENNKKDNLEYVTRQENTLRGKMSDLNKEKSSIYRGVCWSKSSNMWSAYTRLKGKRISLGYFHDEHEAGMTYKKFMIEQKEELKDEQ